MAHATLQIIHLFHVLLWSNLNEIAVANFPGLVQKVTQDEENVDFKRRYLGHHLGRVEKLLLSDFEGSRSIGGIEVDLLDQLHVGEKGQEGSEVSIAHPLTPCSGPQV